MPSNHHKTQNLTLLLVGVSLLLIVAGAFSQLQTSVNAENIIGEPLVVNFSAPVIQLNNPQGQSLSFSDYKGQVILYNAWATWCPPCQEEMPTLDAYYRAHKQDGFVVIAIEDGELLPEVTAFRQKYNLTFPIWSDPQWTATSAFHIIDLPTSYVIDRNGVARLMWMGATTRDALEKYVTPLLK